MDGETDILIDFVMIRCHFCGLVKYKKEMIRHCFSNGKIKVENYYCGVSCQKLDKKENWNQLTKIIN